MIDRKTWSLYFFKPLLCPQNEKGENKKSDNGKEPADGGRQTGREEQIQVFKVQSEVWEVVINPASLQSV